MSCCDQFLACWHEIRARQLRLDTKNGGDGNQLWQLQEFSHDCKLVCFFSYRKWENAMCFFWKCFCYHEETGQWLWMWNSMLRIWWLDVGKNHWLHLKIDGVINCFANICQHRLEFLVHFETGRWTVGSAWASIPDLCPWLLNCSRALNFTTIF